jgi:hypothetical protein
VETVYIQCRPHAGTSRDAQKRPRERKISNAGRERTARLL